MLIKKEISLLVSSNPELGAVNRSKDGSTFQIQFDDALEIPKDALNVQVSMHEATIWHVVPNIIEDINDTIYIFGDLEAGGTQLFTVKIDQGLYDLPGLNNAIISGLEKLGAKVTDSNNDYVPLINLIPDENTQRVLIRFNYDNVTVDFTQQNTFRDILGFDSRLVGPFPLAPVNETADKTAGFNTVNSFIIESDLVERGIRINNQYNQVIGQILIDVKPGSQIVSQPYNPPKIDANNLIGAKRNVLRFRLTDDRLRPVNTNGEYYTARIVISFDQPLILNRN